MLYNVGFPQFRQTEDVAKLDVWMDLFLGLNSGLCCHLDWGLLAILASCVVVILCLGRLQIIFYVLTLWLWWYWYNCLVGWSSVFSTIVVCLPNLHLSIILCCVTFLVTSFSRIVYFIRHPVTSVPHFTGCFSAILDDVAIVSTSVSRARRFGWV